MQSNIVKDGFNIRAIWGEGVDHLDAEIVGLNPA
jgi:hypothetical protein